MKGQRKIAPGRGGQSLMQATASCALAPHPHLMRKAARQYPRKSLSCDLRQGGKQGQGRVTRSGQAKQGPHRRLLGITQRAGREGQASHTQLQQAAPPKAPAHPSDRQPQQAWQAAAAAPPRHITQAHRPTHNTRNAFHRLTPLPGTCPTGAPPAGRAPPAAAGS